MRTSRQILPGIKAIYWVNADNLPRRVDLSAICRMPVAILTDLHHIDFFDEPVCECKTEKENGGYTDTASLSFLTDKNISMKPHCAFVVTDVNDNSYLIGSRESPHPIVAVQQRAGTPSSDSAGFKYSISHVAIKSLIPCLI